MACEAKPAMLARKPQSKAMKLCKCHATLQGVWIIARTVKMQPLLKITSGIPERATLHGTLIGAIAR